MPLYGQCNAGNIIHLEQCLRCGCHDQQYIFLLVTAFHKCDIHLQTVILAHHITVSFDLRCFHCCECRHCILHAGCDCIRCFQLVICIGTHNCVILCQIQMNHIICKRCNLSSLCFPTGCQAKQCRDHASGFPILLSHSASPSFRAVSTEASDFIGMRMVNVVPSPDSLYNLIEPLCI